MPRSQRIAFLGVAAIIAVVAVVLLSTGGDDTGQSATATPTPTEQATPAADEPGAEETPTPDPTPKPTPEPVVLEPGKPKRIEATQGERVTFRVRSDRADGVHLHGYDIEKPIEAGGEIRFSLKADITGIFEIELENAGIELGSLVVQPK